MWGKPESDDARRVQRDVDRLTSMALEREPPFDLVHAVGSARWGGKWAPLLVVDRSLDPRRPRPTSPGRMLERVLYSLVGPLSSLDKRGAPSQVEVGLGDLMSRALVLMFGQNLGRPREWLIGHANAAGAAFWAAFGRVTLPEDLLLLFGSPPRALQGAAVCRRGSKEFATIGLEGTVNGSVPGFTTAGHLVPGPGSFVARAAHVLRLVRPFGEWEPVVFHLDPIAGPPGYDLAITCSPPPAAAVSFSARGRLPAGPEDVEEYAVCRLDGAVSGRRWGVVVGPMRLAKDDEENRKWENCWSVTGQVGWFCKQGDSGACVTLQDGRVLGLLVGGFRIGGLFFRSRMEIGFVQDLSSTIDFALTARRFNIDVLP